MPPAAIIAPGERTGKYQLDLDQLVVNASSESHISVEDYAKALFDELISRFCLTSVSHWPMPKNLIRTVVFAECLASTLHSDKNIRKG